MTIGNYSGDLKACFQGRLLLEGMHQRPYDGYALLSHRRDVAADLAEG